MNKWFDAYSQTENCWERSIQYGLKFLFTTPGNHKHGRVRQQLKMRQIWHHFSVVRCLWDIHGCFFCCHPRLKSCYWLHTVFCPAPWKKAGSEGHWFLDVAKTWVQLLPAVPLTPCAFCIITSLHKLVDDDYCFPVKVFLVGSWGQLIPHS